MASEEKGGNLLRKDMLNSIMSRNVSDNDWQVNKRDSTVPLWFASEPQHDGKE